MRKLPKGTEPGLSDIGLHALSISQGKSPNCGETGLMVQSVGVRGECRSETSPLANRWEGVERD